MYKCTRSPANTCIYIVYSATPNHVCTCVLPSPRTMDYCSTTMYDVHVQSTIKELIGTVCSLVLPCTRTIYIVHISTVYEYDVLVRSRARLVLELPGTPMYTVIVRCTMHHDRTALHDCTHVYAHAHAHIPVYYIYIYIYT